MLGEMISQTDMDPPFCEPIEEHFVPDPSDVDEVATTGTPKIVYCKYGTPVTICRCGSVPPYKMVIVCLNNCPTHLPRDWK